MQLTSSSLAAFVLATTASIDARWMSTSMLRPKRDTASAVQTELDSRCDAGQLIIDIPYAVDKESKLLELTSGSCTAADTDHVVFRHDMDAKKATVTVSIEDCGLAAVLYDKPVSSKSLYMATAYVSIGLRDDAADRDYVYYSATLGTECGTKDVYTVEFEYGEIEGVEIDPEDDPLDPATCDKDANGNCIIPAYTTFDLSFAEYTSDAFDTLATTETKQTTAGQRVYLKLSAADLPDTKEVMINKCTVTRGDDTSVVGQLFDSATSCKNDYIGLQIENKGDSVEMSHRLFLFGSKVKSTFTLSCEVHVCDKTDDSSQCATIEDQCKA